MERKRKPLERGSDERQMNMTTRSYGYYICIFFSPKSNLVNLLTLRGKYLDKMSITALGKASFRETW